jgi:transcriptional regulator with XRE-family HTH domain
MNRLRIVRAEKKMTQFKLSVLTGIIQSRLSYIENSLIEPSEDEKKKIAEALGVRLEEIWDRGTNAKVEEK